MSIANTVRSYLERHEISYEILEHPHSQTSEQTADAAFIWEDQLAKTVLLEDDGGYVMAVVPASHRLDLAKLQGQLRRPLHLAKENELGPLFPDCELGAVPPLGSAYGIATVYDDRLRSLAGVYFEGGDHRDLIYMGGREFIDLLADSQHGDLCEDRES
jgi:Ala-tRNA(Pro) deacylase